MPGIWALAAKGFTVTIVGLERIKAALRGWKKDFNPTGRQTTVLFGQLGRKLRDDVRTRITTQNQGRWPKLSKWTRARTGRRKALVTERKRVVHKILPGVLQVGYNPKSIHWNLSKHQKGFTTKGFSGKRITIPLVNPGALKLKKNEITIMRAKPSIIPARRVWPTTREVLRIITPITNRWVKRQLRKRAK